MFWGHHTQLPCGSCLFFPGSPPLGRTSRLGIVQDPAGEQWPCKTGPDEREGSRFQSCLRANWDRQDDGIPATLVDELATRNGER
jgi:hypothetical protein